jgi:hypothetical protein
VYIAGPSGTPASPTIIRAYPADAVTITGASVSSGQVTIVNTSHITFDGFIITNFNQGLFVDNSHHRSTYYAHHVRRWQKLKMTPTR